MTTSGPTPWAACMVCGHTGHGYQKHLNEVEVPAFIQECVRHLREIEMSGAQVEPLIDQVRQLADDEDGARKAWALWLFKLLEELEHASDAPEVAMEIESFLIGGYSS